MLLQTRPPKQGEEESERWARAFVKLGVLLSIFATGTALAFISDSGEMFSTFGALTVVVVILEAVVLFQLDRAIHREMEAIAPKDDNSFSA